MGDMPVGMGLALNNDGIREMLKLSKEERVELYRKLLDSKGMDLAEKEEKLRGMVLCATAADHIKANGGHFPGDGNSEDPWETNEVGVDEDGGPKLPN